MSSPFARTGTALVVIAAADSTFQNQITWLFGISAQDTLEFHGFQAGSGPELDLTSRYILETIGIEVVEPEDELLDGLVAPYGFAFPGTREFSSLARDSLPQVSARDDPDLAVVAWMEREERLFRRLERKIVSRRLAEGFATGQGDVEAFLSFSLSVQNRRKARAGSALEHHLEVVFTVFELQFVRGAETENRNKPDFLFPGQAEYRNPQFPSARLVMLGAKSTLKDRWRQVLSEATRIPEKHLLTLEPGVSQNQTDEMRSKGLQLVVPSGIHPTYKPAQRAWLMDLAGFLSETAKRQR